MAVAESKSETPGGPTFPSKSVGESSGGGPVPDSSPKTGFGHEWTPPPSGVDSSAGDGFPKGPLHPSLPWVGGDSASRK